jgi:DNA-binding MarR family transcriptional regulator
MVSLAKYSSGSGTLSTLPTPETYRLENSLGYQLTVTSRTHERRLESLLQAIGLNRMEFTVLVAVGREGRSQPSDVADFLGIEKPAVSRALRELEKKKLLVVGKPEADRRVRLLGLTATGHERLAQGIAAAVAANTRIHQALTDEECAQLSALMAKVRGPERTRMKQI